MSKLQQEINRRRTFAIISHPDAGKTTLTEKFLLYGGAIQTAGSVKGKASDRHAVSDWMEMDKKRGISITSSVMQFEYDGYCINILDTPGPDVFEQFPLRRLAESQQVIVLQREVGLDACLLLDISKRQELQCDCRFTHIFIDLFYIYAKSRF